jgi:hypothetical protein
VLLQSIGFVALIALVGTRIMRRSSPLLEVSNLSKRFGGVKAVNSVSFSLKEDELFRDDWPEWVR